MEIPRKQLHRILRARLGSALTVIAATAVITAAAAADFPQRPIRFVVPFAAGGTSDIIGRILSARMQEGLGQPLVVDNRGGAGGSIGTDIVAKANADGYTLVLGSNGTHAIVPYLYKNLPYDPIKDFTPVSMVVITPTVLAATPDLPVKSVKDLIALAKNKPGSIAYGSSGVGSTTHIAGEMMASMAGIQLNHVPYKSASAAYPDVFSGRVALIFDTALSMLQHIKAERVRPLAVTTPARASILPNLPTISEAGVPGYAITLWIAIYAPAGTPAPVIAKLNKEVQRALNLPEVREQMTLQGAEVAVGSPADLLAATKSDLKKMGELANTAKIVPQ
ncbi:MAG: tripartite tricarboxylate transporter substrate binding protein [Proteobacteria bacterium]|nr:tripartite tricarboxylate transporter substrate binding protein [Pseudomonadota bacterium]